MLSGLCFGFLGYFGKLAFAKGVSPFELLSLRFLLSGSLMVLGLFIFTRRMRAFPKSRIPTALLMGIFGYAIFSSCYFLAVQGLSASMAVLLLYTYPLFVVLGTFFLQPNVMSKQKLLLVFLTLGGIVLLIGGDFQVHRWTSFAIGLASGITYAIFILGSANWLKGADALVSSSLIQLGSGAALFGFGFQSMEDVSKVWQLASVEVLGLAVVCSIIPITLFQLGVQKLKEWEVSILSTTEPIMALFVSGYFLGDKLNPVQFIGGAILIFAMLATSLLR